MGEILFIIKSIVLTCVVVVLLQVKLGTTTVEQKSLHWLQTSSLVVPLEEVAQGGVKIIEQLWNNTLGSIKGNFFKRFRNENAPGNRSLGIDLERSKAYLQEQAEKARAKAEELVEASQEEDSASH